MKWLILLVGVVVVCFVVALVLGLVGGGMGSATSSLSHEPLPDDELHDPDLDELRFDVGLRGYRMSQVDGVLDRLRRELREKDEQIAVLRGDPSPPPIARVADDPATAEKEADGSVTTMRVDAGGPAPSTDEQPREGEPSHAQSVDAQLVDAQLVDAQLVEEQPVDEQTVLRQRSEPTP